MIAMTVFLRALLVLFAVVLSASVVQGAEPPLIYPLVAKYGGVAARPNAQQPPRAGAKVVFDLTADAAVADVNKGLDRAARLLNLYGAAGLKSSDLQLAIVLHGEATKSALSDAAYQRRFDQPHNPNLPLLRELQRHGVQVLVCGQALNYKGIADAELADGISIAVSALTTTINKQLDGYAYLPVH
jgi:intracellular sulfur oxidation DsrE/DsrF family protein